MRLLLTCENRAAVTLPHSFIRRQAPAGMSTTTLEVTGHAHRLARHLAHIEPKSRGRRR